MKVSLLLLFSFLAAYVSAQEPNLVLPLGHTNIVRTARFSPDDKFVITGSADKTAKVWETYTGKKIRDLDGSRGEVIYAFFSNNSKYIAVGTDSAVRIWQVPEYKLINEFNLTRKALFSPDSKKLFLVDFSGNLKQVNLADKKTEFVYKDSVIDGTVSFSADSKLVCMADSSSFSIREIISGKLVATRKITATPITCFFTNDHNYFVMFTKKGMQRFDITKDFQPLNFISWDLTTVVKSKNQRYVFGVSGGGDGSGGASFSTLWDFEKYKPVFESDTALSMYDTIPNGYSLDGAIPLYRVGTLKYAFPRYFYLFPVEVSNSGQFIRAQEIVFQTFNTTANYEVDGNFIRTSEFSSDDKYLLIQQKEGTVSLLDVATGKIVQDYKSNADNIRTIAITDDGKNFLVGGYDSTIKICETATGRTLHVLRGHTDLVKYAMFNHKGDRVITNSLDSSAKLWDAGTGELLKTYKGQFPGTNPAYFSSEDELALPPRQIDSMMVPDLDNLDSFRLMVIERELVNPENLPNQKSKSGRYTFYTTPSGTLVMSDAFGENRFSTTIDFSVYAFSPDEKMFALANGGDDTLLIRDIEGNKWLFAGKLGLLPMKHWYNYGIQQLLFTNKYLLVVDANDFIHVLSFDGKQQFSVPGQRCAVSGDSKYLVTANQGECNVYDFEKRKLLYRFISVDTANYLVVDSAKRFDGSDAARKNLYYVCGNEIIDLEQIKGLSWEPDLVAKITGVIKQPITAKKLSEINICNYVPKAQSTGLKAGKYQFELTSQKGGIGEVQLFVNGKMIKKYDPGVLQRENNKYILSVNADEVDSFFVSGAENKVAVKATTHEGNLTSRGVDITRSSKKAAVLNPNMYILAVGIGKYKSDALQLNYASKDALDFATALGNSAKELLNTDGKQHVNTYIFNTDSGNLRWPTKRGIERAVNEIRQFATADDILVIFFAGHGVLPAGKTNLLLPTAEAESFSQVESVPDEVAISFKELMQWLQKIKAAKQLIILDVCNSGQAVKNLQDLIVKRREIPADQQRALDNLTGTTGSCVLAASAEGQPAYETSLYEQGLLTYSLLSGLKLGNGLRDNKYVQVNTWFDVAISNVQQMAKEIGGRQDPKKFGNASFDIGVVDKNVVDAIKLSIKKKVFRRSRLVLEGPIPSDNIGLTALIDKRLMIVSTRGKESPLTYIADNTLLNPYSIIGSYKMTGNNLHVNVYLIRGDAEDKPVHQFEIDGTIDKKDELAAGIVAEVERFLK